MVEIRFGKTAEKGSWIWTPPLPVLLSILSFLMAVVLPGIAEASDSARFQAYLGSDVHQELVFDLWQEQSAFLCEDGTRPEQLGRVGLWILKPVKFDGGEHPADGVWMQRMRGPACGREATYNFLFGAETGGPPKHATLIPGMSNADDILQRDVVKAVVPAAMALAGCAPQEGEEPDQVDYKILDTSQDQEFESGVSGEWQEIWDVAVCGQEIKLQVTFSQDGQGGTNFNVTEW